MGAFASNECRISEFNDLLSLMVTNLAGLFAFPCIEVAVAPVFNTGGGMESVDEPPFFVPNLPV